MGNKNRKLLTLCIIHQHPMVLLGMKKRGFGAGRWNGFGGKVKEGENSEEAARREVEEEVGLVANKVEKAGVIEFRFRGKPEFLEVHVFRVEDFNGTPRETEEMRPQWFEVDNVPYNEMWSADRHWLPLFFENKKFHASFFYEDEKSDVIIDKSVFVVKEKQGSF